MRSTFPCWTLSVALMVAIPSHAMAAPATTPDILQPDSRLQLTFGAGIAVGELHVDGAWFQVLGIGDHWSLRPVAVSDRECGVVESAPRGSFGDPRRPRPSPIDAGGTVRDEPRDASPWEGVAKLLPTEVDVLVLYTPAVLEEIESQLSLEQVGLMAHFGYTTADLAATLAQQQIDKTNQIFLDSGIGARVRLAHVAEVDRAENEATIEAYLGWVRQEIGQNGSLEALREQHEADLVSFWVVESGVSVGLDGEPACGVGDALDARESQPYYASAFAASVVDTECLVGGSSFAHELAHNFGASHDRHVSGAGSPSSYFDYSHGFIRVAWHPTLPSWRTVMAYGDHCEESGFACPRIPRFSNPDVSYMGHATGAAGQADNARTINRTAYYVSRYMPRPDPNSLPPVPTP